MALRKNSWNGFILGLLCALIFVALRSFDPPILATLRGAGFDTLQTIWPRRHQAPQAVRIVDIDEASLRQLGQWPWPRSYMASLVNELDNLGAAAIVFDIVFPEEDRSTASNDNAFAAAINSRPVVTAFSSSSGATTGQPQLKAGFAQTGNTAINAPPRMAKFTLNLPALDSAARGLGGINIDLAKDQGIARQIPLLWTDEKQFYPSLTLEALRVAQGADTYIVNASAVTDNAIESVRIGEFEIPTSESGMFQIYYRPNDPNIFVSATDVINAKSHDTLQPLIKGQIVLIGTSAMGLLDMRTSALGEEIPGVAVHAQALEQILDRQFLSRPEWLVGAEFIGVIVFCVLLSLLTMVLRPLPSLIITACGFAALAATVALSFLNFGLLLDFTFPALALATTFLATTAYKLLVTDQDSRQMRRVFGHYVAPEILTEIERNPSALKLGGELREVTVMFVDIENFTPLSEKLTPEYLVQTINAVLDTCSNAILSEGGTIDKYIGDAVMAFWNAPLPIADHQYHAALAALKIQKAVGDLNATQPISSILKAVQQWPIKVRIGFASGKSTVGNMGSLQRFDYSVLGETVNIAARAEHSCKQIAHNIVLAGTPTDKTAKLALLPAGHVAMKGKAMNTPVYAILGDENMVKTSTFHKMMQDYFTALPRFTLKNTLALAKANPQLADYFTRLATRRDDFKKM